MQPQLFLTYAQVENSLLFNLKYKYNKNFFNR